MISIFAIGAPLTTSSAAWSVISAKLGHPGSSWAVLFIAGVIVCYWAEMRMAIDVLAPAPPGGNMEGKECSLRHPSLRASLAVITTRPRCGAVNAMHGLVHRAGRHDSADQHPARRDHRRGVCAGMMACCSSYLWRSFRRRTEWLARTPEYGR